MEKLRRNNMFSMINTVIASFLSILFTFSSITGIWEEPKMPKYETPETVQMMEIDSEYVIVTSENQTASEKKAAEILQEHLQEISDINLPIVFDSETHEKEIVVGITNRENTLYTIDRESLGNEGVFIKTVGNKVILTGGAQRGTIYCVYTFLEDYLGCRWFTKNMTVIPKTEKILIPQEIDYFFKPSLEFRDTNWSNVIDSEFSVANKINSKVFRPLDDSIGGGISYAGPFCHSLQHGLIPDADYEKYPETQALGIKSGKRTKLHPCLSAEKTYEIVLNNVFTWLESYPESEIVSVTHPDNQDYCACDSCKAVYEEEGSPAGLMLRFVNRIADAVAQRYPDRDIEVDTFAYQYTRKVPKFTVPRDNVIVRLCSIECCFAHPLNDPSCEENVEFIKDLKDWSKVSKRLYIWDYTTNFNNYNGPFNNWAVMQPNMKVFVENNVVGVFEEGNQQQEVSGEFSDLRSYILSKLLWDSNADVNKHMIEFCNAYYGDAAEYILLYLTLVTDRTGGNTLFGKKEHMGIFKNITRTILMEFGLNDITYIDSLWEKAKAVSTLSEDELFRVRRSEISWRYWKACNKTHEFSLLDINEYYKSAQKLYDDLKEFGLTRIHLGDEGLLAEKPNFLTGPGKWTIKKAPDFPPGMYY